MKFSQSRSPAAYTTYLAATPLAEIPRSLWLCTCTLPALPALPALQKPCTRGDDGQPCVFTFVVVLRRITRMCRYATHRIGIGRSLGFHCFDFLRFCCTFLLGLVVSACWHWHAMICAWIATSRLGCPRMSGMKLLSPLAIRRLGAKPSSKKGHRPNFLPFFLLFPLSGRMWLLSGRPSAGALLALWASVPTIAGTSMYEIESRGHSTLGRVSYLMSFGLLG